MMRMLLQPLSRAKQSAAKTNPNPLRIAVDFLLSIKM
jgi:hypothetical protein